MITREGIDKNFRFMVLRVARQLDEVHRIMASPAPRAVRRIRSSDNYIDGLKHIIEKKCLSYFRHARRIDKNSADTVSAISTVASNLERIADFCANIASHTLELHDSDFLQQFDYDPYFQDIRRALDLVADALLSNDTAKALELCHTESRLNRLYERDFATIKERLRDGRDTDDLVLSLYILHYLERIGDSLLNIGEAILSAATGERIKMREYIALDETLHGSGAASSIGDCSIEFKYETRSGNRIGKVEDKSDLEAIFKEGNREKLIREKENTERWGKLMPGVTPRVLEFRDAEGEAALLLEFLDGLTFQDLVLSAESEVIHRALSLTQDILNRAWTTTRQDEPIKPMFLEQLASRFEEVLRVHPEFQDASRRVGSLAVGSTTELIADVRNFDQQLEAPFQVLVHGDLNSDNIIYNHQTDRIHLIDLHRSRSMDYVQDVSVFLVSNFRMPVFEPDLRGRLNDIILRFYNFAREFAQAQGDETFEARLALGLARSFLTSTRFELNEDFAKVMQLRSTYLLEKIAGHAGRPWDRFKLALETLTY